MSLELDEQTFSHLTPEQRAVVAHEVGHARVSAVAGAGKTSTMIARVLALLAKGSPPARLLVLMFNRSARDEFAERLSAKAREVTRSTGSSIRFDEAGLPPVRTFHSLGMRLCNSLVRWGYIPERQLLNADWQRERLARQAIIDIRPEWPDIGEEALDSEALEVFTSFCDRVKGELTAPDIMVEEDEFGPDKRYFVAAYHRHEQLLKDQGVMTYSDLLHVPLKTIARFPELKQRLSGFLDHVIIDEYQDINEAQIRLISILIAPLGQVMAVGDANQCIYEWRGARVDAMMSRFNAYFGQPTDYPLSCTFRHGHALALMANHAIEANQQRPDQITLAAPQAATTGIGIAQGAGQLETLLLEWQASGRLLSDTAVLIRSWALSVPVQLTLMRAGIPFQLSRDDRFVFRLPLVRSLAGFLEIVEDPGLLHQPEHLLMLFTQPTAFVARERLVRLCESLAENRQWPAQDSSLLAGLKPYQRSTLKKRWALIEELPSLRGRPTVVLLEKIIERLDAQKLLRRAASRREKGEEDVRLLDVLLEQARLAARDTRSFIALLSNPVESSEDGVVISTVHGAKGLEWPLVAVWGLNEEDFPLYSREMPLTPVSLEAERRLYYVAITRAKEQLVLFSDEGERKSSRFLAESEWALCAHIGALLDGAECAESDNPINIEPLYVAKPELVERYCRHFGVTLPVSRKQVAPDEWVEGDRIEHANFGTGEIERIEGEGERRILEVRFDRAGKRRLMANRAPIQLAAG
ncbi:ATP-dependent DNA helicase PcrA [Halomonadaceae bacterium LMG 33818]|uniref:ATP-dependent helicase n=1 Tax=Cernens ardua TaxID=3402176 RepID=UPI003EDBE023